MRAAPVEVGDVFRHVDDAEVLARRVEYPDSARSGDVDIAARVALHTVDNPVPKFTVADVLGEDPAIAQRSVRGHIEDADVGARGIVDVKKLLVRREAEAIAL